MSEVTECLSINGRWVTTPFESAYVIKKVQSMRKNREDGFLLVFCKVYKILGLANANHIADGTYSMYMYEKNMEQIHIASGNILHNVRWKCLSNVPIIFQGAYIFLYLSIQSDLYFDVSA